MKPYPHHYRVSATAAPTGSVALESEGLPPMVSASPAEFDGPGDLWSPETLLVAAIADCYLLTFRAVARAANLAWVTLDCDVEGLLERVDGKAHFTGFVLYAYLRAPAGTDEERARHALHKAESACLISNSLVGSKRLEVVVEIVG